MTKHVILRSPVDKEPFVSHFTQTIMQDFKQVFSRRSEFRNGGIDDKCAQSQLVKHVEKQVSLLQAWDPRMRPEADVDYTPRCLALQKAEDIVIGLGH